MALKATFDPIAKLISLTSAPDVNGFVRLDVQKDLYSDGKADWQNDLNLNKFNFPFTTFGGNPLGDGVFAGAYYILDNTSGWRIRPYPADQELTINGNLFGLDPTVRLFVPAESMSKVLIRLNTSSLTQQVQSGSGLSVAQDQLLTDIGNQTDSIPDDVWEYTRP